MNGHPPETTLLSLASKMPRRPDRRDDERELSLLRIACLLFDDRRELCLIRNVSAGGALVRTYSMVDAGRPVAIELKQGESVSGVVRWSQGNLIGVMFHHLVDVTQLLADSCDWPRPRQPRVEIRAPVWLQQSGKKLIGQSIDLSQGGLKVRTRLALEPTTDVQVEIGGLPPLQAICRWACRDSYGLKFQDPIALKTLVRWVREQQSRCEQTKRHSALLPKSTIASV